MKKLTTITCFLLFPFFIYCGSGLNKLFEDAPVPGSEDIIIVEPTKDEPDKHEIIFVSPLGKDANPGTKNQPLQTIQAGIQLANDKSFTTVYIAGGLFTRDGSLISPINGISLYGGFSSDFKARNQETIIQDSSTSGGQEDNPNKAIYIASPVDNSTILDGFTIIGGGGDYSTGIFIEGASPIIRNCSIKGGEGSILSIGILLKNSSDVYIIKNNIDGGKGAESYGITLISNSSANANNNCITGGATGFITTGIYVNNSAMKILNNTINGGSAVDDAIGISIYNLALSQIVNIENNIIFTTTGSDRTGVMEKSKNADPSTLRNNDIFNCPQGLYVNHKNMTVMYLGKTVDVNRLTDILSVGNISEDPLFENQSSGDWHLSDLSPQQVKGGGLNAIDQGYEIDPKDKDGKDRPETGTAWAIGAYE